MKRLLGAKRRRPRVNRGAAGDASKKQDRDAVVAYVGGSQCEKTTLISEAAIECVTPPGKGVDTRASVVVRYNNARGEAHNKNSPYIHPQI